ncbi:hypothetical protein HanIR_Chr11g0558851 [Helianthus annuus]|nr:hypothetical protein HanIR_Chr11g0558851 [Helianthus annuus]
MFLSKLLHLSIFNQQRLLYKFQALIYMHICMRCGTHCEFH